MHIWLKYRGYIILTLLYLLGFGLYVLLEHWPRPESITIAMPTPGATSTIALIRVHVLGGVQQPGVYTLDPASRVNEAVEAAGGLSADADAERVNLAEHLADGQQVYIPRRDATPPPSPTPLAQTSDDASTSAPGERIDINTASAEELTSLPGIGPTYAQRIVAYRQEHGPFTAPEEIMQVEGIGSKRYEQIRDLIIVR